MMSKVGAWPATQWRGTADAKRAAASDQNVADAATVARLRLGIGTIGFLLPIALPLGNLFFDKIRGLPTHGWWPPSMSSSYYTSSRNLFVGGLCALGVFLIGYRYRRREDLFSTIAGFSAVGVALCPTTHPNATYRQEWIGGFHTFFAGVLLVGLAMFCLVSFRDQTKSKEWIKSLYLWSGVIILVAVCAALGLGFAGIGNNEFITPLYIAEWVSVWAFGAAWLTAARDLYREGITPPSADESHGLPSGG
jgi:hypothetical protein